MKQRGFTLIELLAVIVILAIIALIATPIILNIIEESKENAALRSAELYVDAVQQSIANKLLDDSTKNYNGEYEISNNGKTLTLKTDSTITLNPKYSGNGITEGSITITNGLVSNLVGAKIDGYELEMVDNKINIKGKSEESSDVVTPDPEPQPVSFATDSWATIKANKNSDVYQVGNEREVEIDGTSYTVRIANKSTPSACSGENYSQTACGFVVEFVDMIEKRAMNSTDTNEGGYPASEMYTYLQGGLYNKLPSDLKSAIINTKVVSGYSTTNGTDTANFTSENDKLYLLSTHEVWEDGTSNEVSGYDKSYSNTHQLEYYANNSVTTSNNYSYAIKQYNGTNASWWLRPANSRYSYSFLNVRTNGSWTDTNANNSYGVSPAFRI